MKSILFVLSIFLSFQAFADAKDVVQKSRDVSRLLWDKERDLTEGQVKEIDVLLDKVMEVVNNPGVKDLVCVESTSKPGKYCLKSLGGDNTCLGNMFESKTNCQDSVRVSKRGYACYESKDKPGKGLVAKVAVDITRISNYYSEFKSCTESMEVVRDTFMCLESEKHPGKFFMGNLEKDGEIVGPYFGTLGECTTALKNRPQN